MCVAQSGSIEGVESLRSQEQRTATSEQGIGRILRVRANRGRDDAGSRRGHGQRDRERRRGEVERCRLAGSIRGGCARDVRDRAAARRPDRGLRRRGVLLRSVRVARAAARRTRDPVVRAAVPRCPRSRRHQDQDEQDRNDASHARFMIRPCRARAMGPVGSAILDSRTDRRPQATSPGWNARSAFHSWTARSTRRTNPWTGRAATMKMSSRQWVERVDL